MQVRAVKVLLISILSLSFSCYCTEQSAVPREALTTVMPANFTNVTPTHISEPSTMAVSAGSVSSWPSTLVTNYAVPSALGQLASTMKNPYLLLAVSEGIALTYILFGQHALPMSAGQAYIETFQHNMALPLLTGAVSAVAGSTATALLASTKSYVKPLIVGGSLIGAATAAFSPGISDDQKAVLYAGLVAACMPIVQEMYAAVIQDQKTTEQKTVLQKIKEGQKRRAEAERSTHTQHVTTIAVALLALGGVVTTMQAFQEGTLSPETQLMAGITLSHAVALARETVLYEYGYRATQKGIAGANIVTHVIAEPIQQYGRRLIDGVFNAFGWGGAQSNN